MNKINIFKSEKKNKEYMNNKGSKFLIQNNDFYNTRFKLV